MEIIANTLEFYLKEKTAAAIGKFDGIHMGHRKLLGEILSRKQDGMSACVFTFDPAPAVFFKAQDARELTVKEEKRLLFERMGVDILVEFPLNHVTAGMPPEEFVSQVLARRMNVGFLAAGRDLSFGAGGAGNAELLRRMGSKLGFNVEIIDKVCLKDREVSSTYVRSQVEEGNMELAAQLLGMPYMVAGRVVRGKQIGRTLGFPTVNIIPGPDKLLPPAGVYYSTVCCKDRMFRAISNVGYKPTVTSERIMGVESFLYDYDGDMYDAFIEVYLHSFRRPERHFETVEDLRRQLDEDIRAGRQI